MKKKKSGNVKRRNVQHGKVASVIAIIEGYGSRGFNLNPLTGDSEGSKIKIMTRFGGFCSSNNALWISTLYFSI